MKRRIAVLMSLTLALALAAPARISFAQDAKEDHKQDKKKKKDSGGESTPDPKDTEKQIGRLMKDIQFDLEGGSSRSFLGLINNAKFDDYPRFEDNVERLMRENSLRVNFRTAFSAPPTAAGIAQTSVDAIMELVKKDSTGRPERRSQQLTFDFEWTNRGWKITNISPRQFFNP